MQSWTPVLLAAAVKATALLAAGWGAARLLRRRAAADRHLVWTAAFAAVLLLPAMSVWLPAWNLAVPAEMGPAARFQTGAVTGPTALPQPVVAAGGTDGGSSTPANLPWSTMLWLAWAAGAMLLALRYAAGALWLRRVARGARAIDDPEWRALAGSARLLESPRALMPLTFGWRRPVVLLPGEARAWAPERRRRVLLHELAHVRRHDCLSQALARLACCLYWFHPLAWAAWREFIRERERACDDLVLAAGARASDYAADLLDLARAFPAAGAAGLAMARPSHLEGRLLAILDGNRRRGAATAPLLALALAAALAVTAPLAALHAAQQAPATENQIEPAFRSGKFEALTSLSQAFVQQVDFAAAVQAANRSLSLRESRFGQQSMEYAQGLLQLADVYRHWGKYDQAQPLFERAASTIETVRGPNAPELAEPLFYLGVARHVQSAPAAAAYYARALRLASGNPGLTAHILTFQALAAEQQGDAAGAAELYQKALASAPDGPSTLPVLQLYGRLLRSQNRGVEAQSVADRVKSLQPTPAPPPAEALRIGPGVQAPNLIRKIEPSYTDIARAAKWQGTSVLLVVIGTDGQAHDIQVKSPVGLGLDEQAILAVRQWRFRPGTKEGQPVPVKATIEVNFRLL